MDAPSPAQHIHPYAVAEGVPRHGSGLAPLLSTVIATNANAAVRRVPLSPPSTSTT